MKVIAINQKTGEQFEFFTQRLAAANTGVRISTVSYRIRTGVTGKDGWTFIEKQTPYEELSKTQQRNMNVKTEEDIPEKQNHHFKNKKTHIQYQKNKIGVCITPCPFSMAPKPMVGSAKCQRCSYFNGIDRKLQVVSCSKVNLYSGNVIIETTKTSPT